MDALQTDAQMEQAWEALSVGETLGPLTYQVTERVVDAYCEATEGRHPWFTNGSPFGGRIAPSDLSTTDYRHLVEEKGTSPGYHARHHAEFLEPVLIGDTLTVTGRMAAKFQRRGFRYYTMDYQATNQRGQQVYRQSITATVGVLRDPSYGEEREARFIDTRPTKEEGLILARRHVTQQIINEFASQSFVKLGRAPVVQKNHHTDPQYAYAVGLRGTIGQALLYVAWISQALTGQLGLGWVRGGALDMIFMNSVEAGDTLTIRGWTGAAQPSASRHCLRILVQNQRDEHVAMGEVSGSSAPG